MELALTNNRCRQVCEDIAAKMNSDSARGSPARKSKTDKFMNEKQTLAKVLETLAEDDVLLEIGRRAIEDELVEWRDSRLSSQLRNNGFTIKEKDGSPSSVVRFGPEIGLKIALKAVAKHLSRDNSS